MPEVRNPGLGAGQQALLVRTASLSSSDILALPGTPFPLVPAPGAGKVLVPIYVVYVYNFGTHPYFVGNGLGEGLSVNFTPSGDNPNLDVTGLVTALASRWFGTAAFFGPLAILPGDDNSALVLNSQDPYTAGPILTATLGAGGAGYVANDTGTINSGDGTATYKVLTVDGGGAVVTFQVTSGGAGYLVANGVTTSVGGAQPGVGAGFTVNITAVTRGDGTLKVTTYYQILPVP